MQKIKWKNRNSINCIEGYLNDNHIFDIEGTLCLIDLRGQVPYKTYSITSKDNAKEIASDLINGLNTELHESNHLAWEKKSNDTAKFLQDTELLIKSLKQQHEQKGN